MLTADDILVLPYDSQFSRAGVQYARDSLNYTYNRMRLTPADRLRKIAAGIAFEMAVRRWFESVKIPYNRLGATAFTAPDRFDVAIGGRRCDLKSSLIYDRHKIAALHADPGWVLDATALVPEDQFASERMNEQDIYVFGFVTGLEARQPADTARAEARGLPVCLVNAPPRARWANLAHWRSLGGLALKSNAGIPLTVEVGGQDSRHHSIRERVRLPPGTRTLLKQDYYAVLYLSLPRLPEAAVGLHSQALRQLHLVQPADWANIWIYGQRIYLCGWLNKQDFRARSRRLPARSPVKQYRQTATANLSLPIRELWAMADLAARVSRHTP
jgi:hypothetical protein